MCEKPTLGAEFWPCALYLAYRALVLDSIALQANRLYPEFADSVALQAALAPMGFSHKAPIDPSKESLRLVRKGWAVAREWNPRPIVPGVEFPVHEAKVYDSEADSQWKIRDHDIPELILDRALEDTEKSFWHLDDDTINSALDTLGPLFTRLVRHGFVPQRFDDTDEPIPQHLREFVERTTVAARQRVLSDLGSIGSTKQKRGMTKGPKRRTMGAASEPVCRTSDNGFRWTYDTEGKRVWLTTWEAEILALNPYAIKPKRVGTERAEEGDDRLLDYRRPVAKGNTRKNRRSGRLGGSAVVR